MVNLSTRGLSHFRALPSAMTWYVKKHRCSRNKRSTKAVLLRHQQDMVQLRREIRVRIYRSAIENMLAFVIRVSITKRQMSRIQRVMKAPHNIVGFELIPLTAMHKDR